MPTYIGKVCEKHPEAHGERDQTTRLCVECYREKKRARKRKDRSKRVLLNREARIRYGFEVGDALIVLRNIAIECALARGENGSAHWIRHIRIAARIAESYRMRLVPDSKPLNPDFVDSVVRSHAKYEVAAPDVPRETDGDQPDDEPDA